MNIGKSIKHFLNQQDKTRVELSEYLGLSPTYVSTISNSKTAGKSNIEELSAFFNVKASEFIKAGE